MITKSPEGNVSTATPQLASSPKVPCHPPIKVGWAITFVKLIVPYKSFSTSF